MVCKSLIQHSRDTTGFNLSYSVIESAGRKGWWFIFKNKEEGGELKESSWRVMGLGNEKGRKEGNVSSEQWRKLSCSKAHAE